MVCVSWDDAKAYADWTAEKTGKPYRLPSEAEWEYAARGRTSPGAYPRFWFGSDEKELCQYGNGAGQKARDSLKEAKSWTVALCNDGYAFTSPAGRYQPNAFGLHDMAGNVGSGRRIVITTAAMVRRLMVQFLQTYGCRSGHVARGGAWNSDLRYLRAGFGLVRRRVLRRRVPPCQDAYAMNLNILTFGVQGRSRWSH